MYIAIFFAFQKKSCVPWSSSENEAIRKAFSQFFKRKVYPQHHDVLLALQVFPILNNRGIDKLKHKVKNEIKKLRKA